MARNRKRIDADLDALYRQVPDTGCKGLCVDACGPIGMSAREEERLAEAGQVIPRPEDAVTALVRFAGHWSCPALVEGRCEAYDLRPMICRLYGAAEGLLCEHGCVPEGGHLPATDGRRLLSLSVQIGGET